MTKSYANSVLGLVKKIYNLGRKTLKVQLTWGLKGYERNA